LLAGLAFGGPARADGLCQGELARAMDMRQRIVREWPLRPFADEASQFVQNLALRMAGQFSPGAAQIPWHFALTRNLAPNAFSIGGGYVFVTEGAVMFAQNEEELAAIIAHEMGHELAGHFCDHPPSPENAGGLFDIFTGPPPAPDYHQESAGVGSLRQTVDLAKEKQADQIAAKILRAADYDPRTLLRVAKRLPPGGQGHWFDRGRIQALDYFLSGGPPVAEPKDSAQFQAIKRALADEVPH
jgi:predicted Zn-dependent protease